MLKESSKIFFESQWKFSGIFFVRLFQTPSTYIDWLKNMVEKHDRHWVNLKTLLHGLCLIGFHEIVQRCPLGHHHRMENMAAIRWNYIYCLIYGCII